MNKDPSESKKGISHTIWTFIKDFIYLYLKFVIYAVAIYIIFYIYDYYFG